MKLNFKGISISHLHTPLEAREKVALDGEATNRLYQLLKTSTSLKEVMILSTCNRTEIYYVSPDGQEDDIVGLLGIIKGFNSHRYREHFSVMNGSETAIKHLFRVTAGLESQILGESQIMHQVKKAYQKSVDHDFAGPLIHRLLHTAFFTNKRIDQETSFKVGAASISYTTSELVKSMTQDNSKPKVLVLGLGDMGRDATKNLITNEKLEIFLCNRTPSKSWGMAERYGLKVLDFDQVMAHISTMDIVISSLEMERPFITRESMTFDIRKPLHFIDLSVPRSVCPHIAEFGMVTLTNIDQLKVTVTGVINERQREVPKVMEIVEQSLHDLREWSKEMLAAPTINKMKDALEEIRQQELKRYLSKCTLQEKRMAEAISKSMVQRIMKLPVLQLKAACKRDQAGSLIEVLQDLFDVEKLNTKC